MTIHGVITRECETQHSICIGADGRFIACDGAGSSPGLSIRFQEAIAFPGLINSHDHLDFNAFPLLGNRLYPGYEAWGADIHATHGALISAVRTIPKSLQAQWSLYKNLLNGITTVVQHGPDFRTDGAPVDVFSECVSIHSLRLERNWKLRLNKPRLRRLPVVLHIGEGTGEAAAREIDELARWNLFRRRIVGVHGIAMSPAQARSFHALVWCPESNHFLYGATADIAALAPEVPIVFGTDSTLSAGWDLWQQLRKAAARDGAPPAALYDMLTSRPAAVWDLRHKGSLRTGAQADLVVARRRADDFLDAFMSVRPEDILLVLSRGRIVLADPEVLAAAPLQAGSFSPIRVGSEIKYVSGNLPGLINDIRRYYPAFKITDPEIDVAL